jgi:cation diffusion facilitator family transporter
LTKEKRGIRFVIIGIITNALLAFIKITTGVLGNSYALVADGIESTTDIFSSIVVWSGLRIAAIPPDRDHPYGHGKAEAVSAMLVSLFLAAAAAIIIVNSIHEIILPHHTPEAYTLLVLVAVVITKEILYRNVLKVSAEIHSTSLRTDAWHHRSDAFTSASAFAGISLSLLLGAGYEYFDDLGALAASAFILYNAYRLLKGSLVDIMDAAPSRELENRIIEIAKEIPGVYSVSNVRVRKSGLSYLVDLDIQVSGDISVSEGHDISDTVSRILMNSNLSVQNVMVHAEPYFSMSGIH